MPAPSLAKIVAFGLFLAMGFAAVPLMLRLFLYAGKARLDKIGVWNYSWFWLWTETSSVSSGHDAGP
jgi:hypothetical protein